MKDLVLAQLVQSDIKTEVAEVVSFADNLYKQLPVILTRLAAACAVILLGVFLIRLLKRLVRKSFERKIKKRPNDQRQLDTFRSLLISVITYLSWFCIVMVALGLMGVDVTSLLTVAGIGGIAIGFGAQTLVKDVISGMFLWSEGRLSVGDVVTVSGQTGTVESISLRTTVLRLSNGSMAAVPNGDIRAVVNMTRDFRVAQVDITVMHGQDYDAACSAVMEECALLAARLSLENVPNVIGFISNDGRCATMRIECRCDPREVWALEREIRSAALMRLFSMGIKP